MARRMNNLNTCSDVNKSQKHVIKRNQTHKSTPYRFHFPRVQNQVKTTYSVRCQAVPGEGWVGGGGFPGTRNVLSFDLVLFTQENSVCKNSLSCALQI